MIRRDFYDVVCERPADIPLDLRCRIKNEVASSLGLPVGGMFPEFSKAFPYTVKAIELYYSVPVLLFKKTSTGLPYFLVSESEGVNLFYDLVPASSEVDGAYFDENHAMLPTRWKELYRYFFSFSITAHNVKPSNWKNSPFPYYGRLEIGEYRQVCSIKRKVTKNFESKIDSKGIYCWVLTESGDALFLDEQRRDKKVYHVKDNNFDNYAIIEDAENILDLYLAHLVATNSPEGFDFRQ